MFCYLRYCLNKIFLRILPQMFYYLKFILEGYDNLGILSHYDLKRGLVVLRYPVEREAEMYSLLEHLAPRLSPAPFYKDLV